MGAGNNKKVQKHCLQKLQLLLIATCTAHIQVYTIVDWFVVVHRQKN